MYYIHGSLWAAFFLLTSLHAQTGMEAVKMNTIDVSDFPRLSSPQDIGFKLLTPGKSKEAVYIYHDGEYKRLHTVQDALSQTHYYSGGSPMQFFRKGVDEEGKEVFLPAGQCNLPTEGRDLVICLQLRGSNYQAFPIDLSLRSQPLGSVRFVNFTPANLVVLLNKDRSMIQPGGELTTKFDTEKKVYFNFKIGAMYEDEAKMIFSNRYPFRGEMRLLFIGYAQPGSAAGEGAFRVVSHRDGGPEIRPFIPE